jgi:hypothetical protein
MTRSCQEGESIFASPVSSISKLAKFGPRTDFLGFNITRNTPRTALSERTPGVLSGRRPGHSSRSVPARSFRLASTTDALDLSDARGFRRAGPARPRDDSTDPDPGVAIQLHLTVASGREEARER